MEPPNRDASTDDELRRPWPVGSFRDRFAAWVRWFGGVRLAASAIAMVVVCAGAYWLVRTPAPPTEASLPLVSTTSLAGPDDVTTSSVAAGTTLAVSPVSVVVHVAGAVVAPGVYRLDSGSRVDDAIVLAGGALAEADTDAINLAAPLVDGARVYVPVAGEEVLPPPSPSPSVLSSPLPGASGAGPGGSAIIDVNVATAAELEALPGVGPATAAAIVTERERNGPFRDVDDLDRVPGIGPAKLGALRDLVTT